MGKGVLETFREEGATGAVTKAGLKRLQATWGLPSESAVIELLARTYRVPIIVLEDAAHYPAPAISRVVVGRSRPEPCVMERSCERCGCTVYLQDLHPEDAPIRYYCQACFEGREPRDAKPTSTPE